MAERTCDEPDCERAHRARGLCSMHWKREHGVRRMVDVECPMCGTVTSKQDDGKHTRRFCSLLCRDVWRCDQPGDPMHQLGTRPRGRRGPRNPIFCSLPADHPARWYGSLSRLQESACSMCGLVFMHRPQPNRRYCSGLCAERSRRVGKVARRRIDRTRIFERDAYMCWICDTPTSRTYSASDSRSPTIDHLIPQSLGGSHQADNLATAHMMCNSKRGASWELPASLAA